MDTEQLESASDSELADSRHRDSSLDVSSRVTTLRRRLAMFGDEHRGAVVGVVHGSRSEEDRTYVESGPEGSISLNAVLESLRRQGFHARPVDSESETMIEDLRSVDFVFVNTHGEFGEDGRLQGLLDYLGLRYTGSGVLAGAVGVNKVAFKRMMTGSGIATPRYALDRVVHRPLGEQEISLDDLSPPAMAKPISGGSSLGMQMLTTRTEITATVVKARAGEMFLEEFIAGRALTVAVIDTDQGPLAAPPIEIRFEGDFYDAETKLNIGTGSSCVASGYRRFDADPRLVTEATEIAGRVHALLGCRGFSRVDLIIDPHGSVSVLEVNTIPGMTHGGNFVTCTAQLGLFYDETVMLMLASSTLPQPALA